MRRIATLILLATTSNAALAEPAPPARFPDLEFLVGHCWRGTFPDGRTTDEHCFARLYGGQFVRDTHHVRDATGKVVYEGETTYVRDERTGVVSWRYLSVQGLVMDGTVAREGPDLVFPASYVDATGTHEIRATWTPHDGGYRTRNSEKTADGWKEQAGMEFTRADRRAASP